MRLLFNELAGWVTEARLIRRSETKLMPDCPVSAGGLGMRGFRARVDVIACREDVFHQSGALFCGSTFRKFAGSHRILHRSMIFVDSARPIVKSHRH